MARFIVLTICVSIPIIWFSAKAKPIGIPTHQKPYRWGTFIALMTGMLSLGFFTQIIEEKQGDIFQVISITCLALLSATTCVLLLCRKKPALLSFFVTYSLLFITAVIVSAAAGRRLTPQQIQRDGPLLIFFLFSGYYLWKRRHLFRGSTW